MAKVLIPLCFTKGFVTYVKVDIFASLFGGDPCYQEVIKNKKNARVAELVDAHDSNSCSERGVGSIPTPGTSKGEA